MIQFCDNWVVMKIKNKEDDSCYYKVLAGTSGGYTTGDSWRLNSGIINCTLEDKHYVFHGISGSKYYCHIDTNFVRINIAGVVNQLEELGCEVVDCDTEYLKMDWNLS